MLITGYYLIFCVHGGNSGSARFLHFLRQMLTNCWFFKDLSQQTSIAHKNVLNIFHQKKANIECKTGGIVSAIQTSKRKRAVSFVLVRYETHFGIN